MRILNHISIEIKSAVALTIATFICKGINVISLPLFTRLLSTEEMGIVTTYTSWHSLLSVIANLALDSGSFNIAMMEYKDSRFRYMSFALVISTISSIIIAAVYFAFPIFFQSLTGLDNTLIIPSSYNILDIASTLWLQIQEYIYCNTSLYRSFNHCGGRIYIYCIQTIIWKSGCRQIGEWEFCFNTGGNFLLSIYSC